MVPQIIATSYEMVKFRASESGGADFSVSGSDHVIINLSYYSSKL